MKDISFSTSSNLSQNAKSNIPNVVFAQKGDFLLALGNASQNVKDLSTLINVDNAILCYIDLNNDDNYDTIICSTNFTIGKLFDYLVSSAKINKTSKILELFDGVDPFDVTRFELTQQVKHITIKDFINQNISPVIRFK